MHYFGGGGPHKTIVCGRVANDRYVCERVTPRGGDPECLCARGAVSQVIYNVILVHLAREVWTCARASIMHTHAQHTTHHILFAWRNPKPPTRRTTTRLYYTASHGEQSMCAFDMEVLHRAAPSDIIDNMCVCVRMWANGTCLGVYEKYAWRAPRVCPLRFVAAFCSCVCV